MPRLNVARQRIIDLLVALKLPGMVEAYLRQLDKPNYAALSFDERFAEIIDFEVNGRNSRRQLRLLKESRIKSPEASFENFIFDETQGVQRGFLEELRRCDWIHAANHPWLVITGATGTGKSFLAQALGHEACMNSIPTIYYRMPELLEEMADAARTLTTSRFRQSLNKKALLIIDDFGIGVIDQMASSQLLSLLIGRERCAATIVASQIPYGEWHRYLGSGWEGDAIVDRLFGSSYLVEFKGESRRMQQRPKLELSD